MLPSIANLAQQNSGGLAVLVFMTAYDVDHVHQQEQQDNSRVRAITKAKHQVLESIQQDLYHQALDDLEQTLQKIAMSKN